jgi:hypothetical protein
MADSLLILSLNESGAFGHYAPVAHEIGLSVVCLKNDFEATNAVARTHCDQVFITSKRFEILTLTVPL